ncbi:hypothetical protein MUP07_01960 [Candidatus Bathyarchaeota archaeon]|nr:hypothetical protein [Candidatus Bathyarchaeota archaeon]
MNLWTAYHLTKVLTYSQLRATSRIRGRLDFLRRPSAILLIDAAAFVGALAVAQKLASIFTTTISTSTGSSLAVQAMVDLPVFLMFLVMLSGLLWELSYSFSFTSTDMINHLPITAAEYVLASSASLAFSYSIYVAVGLGGALGLALQFGLLNAWIITVLMSLVAVLIGAFGIEALRAFTNRASSLLYKRSGRAVMILRLVVLIVVFVFFQLVFNPTIMLSLLGSIAGSVQGALYFPLVWPSLAVASYLEDNLPSASLYVFLTFLLCGFFFSACARLRQAYWMPMPVSVKLSTATYAPSAGFLSRLGLNPAESAIVRKDFRSLSRRREMARFLAIPILIVASLLIPSLVSTSQSPASSLGIMFWFFPLILGVTIFALFTSMISVGQEGSAVWNLYSSPLLPRELVRAKVTANIILSLPIAIAFWLGITLLGHTSFKSSLAILLVLAALILAESFVGLALGVKYPDFSETIRSRFIRLTGMLTGMLLGVTIAGAILAPYGLYVLFKLQWLDNNMYFAVACFASLTLTALISAIAYRACVSSTKKLLAGLPV